MTRIFFTTVAVLTVFGAFSASSVAVFEAVSGTVSKTVSRTVSGTASRAIPPQESVWPESVVPGFDSIARDPAAYRQMLEKFSSAEVWASLSDCIIAYYGFAMQPGFIPDAPAVETNTPRSSAQENSGTEVQISDGAGATGGTGSAGATGGAGSAASYDIETNMFRAISADDYQTAYTLGQEILKYRPVDLTALYWTLYSATQTRQSWEVLNSLRGKYNSISHVISLSGNGLDSETAFRVISRGDMYTFTMVELGLEIGEGFLWDNRWTEFRVTLPSTGADARSGVGSGEKFRGSSIFFELFPGDN